MFLFKGCELYAPRSLGTCDVLVAGGRIMAIGENLATPVGIGAQEIPCAGLRMIPGLIDGHVHIAGAGGEGGPASRTAELDPAQLLAGGITTVIGCLGTDGLTRSLEGLLMKAKALRGLGFSCWILTGSYQVPTPTLLGDVGRDIALIDEIIGVGEIAIGDHRSSGPSAEELTRLAAHARVGGMLGGKAGIVVVHIGAGKDPFELIRQACLPTGIPRTQFLPTHCGRSQATLTDALRYAQDGPIDLTAGSFAAPQSRSIPPSEAIAFLMKHGVALERITISSDGCGSLPRFDDDGKFAGMAVGEPRAIFVELIKLVESGQLPWEQALLPVTANVADRFGLSDRGHLEVGHMADLLLLDRDHRIEHMVMQGRFAVRAGQSVQG